MKKKITYTDEPMNLGKTVKDFLPSPAALALKEKTVRITINLNEESVLFFKDEAKKIGVPYQKLIRKVVDLYAEHHV
ncbi:MAG: CopG family transcriptional regulator [SAR324 cluster bacterium]|nr:CopG family transcriptional regulator [SAR324 cluster bacterium]